MQFPANVLKTREAVDDCGLSCRSSADAPSISHRLSYMRW